MKITLPTPLGKSTKRWGQAFTIFLVISTLATWGGTAHIALRGEQVPGDLLLVSLLMCLIIPLNLVLLIPPMFFGGYPEWIVRLFSEPFLTGMINGLFAAPAVREKVATHGKFDALLRQRYALAIFLLLAILAGVASTLL